MQFTLPFLKRSWWPTATPFQAAPGDWPCHPHNGAALWCANVSRSWCVHVSWAMCSFLNRHQLNQRSYYAMTSLGDLARSYQFASDPAGCSQDRQWFKSRCGLPADETSREKSFCAYTLIAENLEDAAVLIVTSLRCLDVSIQTAAHIAIAGNVSYNDDAEVFPCNG